MTSFTFIHAADIHLDSPMAGLAARDGSCWQAVRGATRRAFAKMVDLAIRENASFVVVAGDLYDGTWKDHSTGQFAVQQFARLSREGIRTFVVFGNHDAQTRITRHLAWPDGVHAFGTRACDTVRLDDLDVAIHGRSYRNPATTENLAAEYCAPVPGLLNVAVLHTSLDGHPGHANYAPCSLAQLQASGHDYWALGHVHERSIRSEHPWVVFPGNMQGRSIRETGARGAMLVRVVDGAVRECMFHPLDEVRWEHARIDAAGATDPDDVLSELRHRLAHLAADADPVPLIARVDIRAHAHVRERVLRDPGWFEAEVRGRAEMVSAALWIERVRVSSAEAPTATGLPPELVSLLQEAARDPDCLQAVRAAVRPLLEKLPGDIGDTDTTPLIAAAREGDAASLAAAASSSVAARLGPDD